MEEQEFIFDLVSELRKNPKRREAVVKALRDIDIVTLAHSKGKASRHEIVQAEAKLMPLCGFNFGLLIPKFFPRYPFEQPLDFGSRPFMYAMTATAPGSVVTFKAGRQVGKCATGDTEVTTNRGAMTLSELFDAGVSV